MLCSGQPCWNIIIANNYERKKKLRNEIKRARKQHDDSAEGFDNGFGYSTCGRECEALSLLHRRSTSCTSCGRACRFYAPARVKPVMTILYAKILYTIIFPRTIIIGLDHPEIYYPIGLLGLNLLQSSVMIRFCSS